MASIGHIKYWCLYKQKKKLCQAKQNWSNDLEWNDL